jgi:hypothetical protein
MGQKFDSTVARTCERAGIESQPMLLARCGVSACEANSAKIRLVGSNNGTTSAHAKPSVAKQRHKRATS